MGESRNASETSTHSSGSSLPVPYVPGPELVRPDRVFGPGESIYFDKADEQFYDAHETQRQARIYEGQELHDDVQVYYVDVNASIDDLVGRTVSLKLGEGFQKFLWSKGIR
jgi:hypothetical protein